MQSFGIVLGSFVLLHGLAVAGTLPEKPGVSLVPPPGNTGAVHPTEQASTLRDPKKGAGKTLRCWQHGRLVFEDSGFKDGHKMPNAVQVPRHDGDTVTVFDQKDSLCLLSSK